MGNPKFRDTANAMAKPAHHLLATYIEQELRSGGFTAVNLDGAEVEVTANALNETGRFIRLDPGSQNLRMWIGIGAGESKVCISGKVTDASGQKPADFADCRNGLGWGSSTPQMDKGADIPGARLARFLIDWAEAD